MTREEAIKELENMKKFNYTLAPLEVFDMAIKALWAVEHMPTTKNNLGVDCISRERVLKLIYDYKENHSNDREHYPINYGTLLDMIRWVRALPSVTPQLSSELEKNSKKLEKDFGELDCISRADAIRVASGYCHPSNVAKELAKLPSVTPQEPILDKITEIIEPLRHLSIDEMSDIEWQILRVIDKYKAESEGKE